MQDYTYIMGKATGLKMNVLFFIPSPTIFSTRNHFLTIFSRRQKKERNKHYRMCNIPLVYFYVLFLPCSYHISFKEIVFVVALKNIADYIVDLLIIFIMCSFQYGQRLNIVNARQEKSPFNSMKNKCANLVHLYLSRISNNIIGRGFHANSKESIDTSKIM